MPAPAAPAPTLDYPLLTGLMPIGQFGMDAAGNFVVAWFGDPPVVEVKRDGPQVVKLDA